MTKEEFKETYFDLDDHNRSVEEQIYHCIDRAELDLANKILNDYANQRAAEELKELRREALGTPERMIIWVDDLNERLIKLKQEI